MNDTDDFSERLELFFGDASDAVCYFYTRLRGESADGEFQLTGTLVGPACRYAHTLKATSTFADRGPGESLLAVATLPEPSFWSPEMPHLYQAQVQLRRAGQIIASATRTCGIRLLGKEGRKLVFDARRWVPRAVSATEAPHTDLAEWRQCDATLLARNPSDALCEQASQIGVLLFAELDAASDLSGKQIVDEIRRLSRWPAVGMVVLPGTANVKLNGLAHNLLLAARFAPQQTLAPPPWADAIVCDVVGYDWSAGRIADCRLPVIVARQGTSAATIAEARAGCDRLQRDLAGKGDIAGYLV